MFCMSSCNQFFFSVPYFSFDYFHTFSHLMEKNKQKVFLGATILDDSCKIVYKIYKIKITTFYLLAWKSNNFDSDIQKYEIILWILQHEKSCADEIKLSLRFYPKVSMSFFSG